MKTVIEAWIHPAAPSGVERITYTSDVDGLEDWALALPPRIGQAWVVHLHGHGSTGDQIYTRDDLRDLWLSLCQRRGVGILSPNLRGNAWMCPEAVADLHVLLDFVRRRYGAQVFYFVSGSMGGTGNLIYAAVHPADVALVVALCPATDMVSYHAWLGTHPGGVCDEIRAAIEQAYGGRPDQVPARYAQHSALAHADRLTMPLLVVHASGDAIIPVEQSQGLWQQLAGTESTMYKEIEGGDHDSPLHWNGLLDWLERNIQPQ